MHKATFAPNKASMRPDTKGERPTLSHDHRTDGRIKTGKKRFCALWVFTEIKQVLLPVETLWERKKPYFSRASGHEKGRF
jgi:hypothetical protein